MEHEKLVDYVKKYFVEHEAIWEKESSTQEGLKNVDSSVAQYTGGLVKVSHRYRNLYSISINY